MGRNYNGICIQPSAAPESVLPLGCNVGTSPFKNCCATDVEPCRNGELFREVSCAGDDERRSFAACSLSEKIPLYGDSKVGWLFRVCEDGAKVGTSGV